MPGRHRGTPSQPYPPDGAVSDTRKSLRSLRLWGSRLAIIDNGRIVAGSTPDALKARVGKASGHDGTLEDVFMGLTGRPLRVEEEE